MAKSMRFVCNAKKLIIAIFLCRKGKNERLSFQGKDRAELTTVLVVGNHMQTRQSKMKRISQGKEKEI